jgi:hypothetical protein
MSWWDDALNKLSFSKNNQNNNSTAGFSQQFALPANSLNDLAFGNVGQTSGYNLGTNTNNAFAAPSWMDMGLMNGTVPDAQKGGGLFSMLFGGKDKNGFQTSGVVSPLASLLGSGAQAWLGSKQVGLAEDTLDFQKDAFSRQFNNQAALTNSSMRDRQAVRYDRDPSRYQSPDEYMKQNKVG